MESRRVLIYVDTGYVYQPGQSVRIREPDWFPKVKPKFKKLYKEDINE